MPKKKNCHRFDSSSSFGWYPLGIHNIIQYNLIGTGSNVIHQSYPSHHIRCFQFFRYTLLLCHFLYQIFRHITSRSIDFSNRKAWWKCKDCGREWNTLISTRSGGSKCPYCSGYIFLKGFNDLQTTHPEIASEWSEKNLPLKPDEVNAKSRKNVWWKCRKCGNEWKSVINARVKGTVCPVCAEREVLAGYNDLATTDSQLLSEWDYEQNKLKPTEVSRTSAKRAWWKCRHGHSWSMKINERTILNKGCRICEQEYLSSISCFGCQLLF